MSEIALLSSRAVIVGVVHITLVVHIRPVSPIEKSIEEQLVADNWQSTYLDHCTAAWVPSLTDSSSFPQNSYSGPV